MYRTSVYRVLPFIVLALLAPVAWAGDALNFFNNWFVTGDYVVGGVGLRATGVNGWATGTINMTGVPVGAEPVAAFLYWSTSEPTTTPAARIGYFNGHEIQAAVLGNPQSPNLPCYSSGGALGLPGTAGQVYRADVFRYLPVDANNVRQVNGKHTVKLPDSGGNGNGNLLYTDGASLVVIYRVVTPGNPAATPLRAVVIYNGAFSMDKHSSGMTQNVAGFYEASASAAAKITNIVANGQSGFSTPLSVNGTTLKSNPFVGALGGRWDNPTYSFNLAKDASSFSTLTTVGGNQTCVTWAAMVASMNVQDSDRDGLLDVWETKGMHRNTQVSPATFGGCSDYREPCVDLPSMGANLNVKDIFIQMDWMHGSGGTGGTDGAGTHDHIPKLGALSVVAGTFALHGINLHFDVGRNYQNACGTPITPAPCSFIIPASNGQGGSDIDETTLVCKNTATHVCDYQEPYPILSFEFGFATVRDGNHLLNISPHFAQNRKDIFHYALFAHALGGPFDINGHPIDPSTGEPTTVPRSYSGIAHRPGGGFMVTFGLWPSDFPGDDQVGSTLAQAGTIMHELGHNLDLAHGGLSPQPNCMPNYQSVMNYLYRTRGLTSASGEHVDYSFGTLLNGNPLSESSLPTGALANQQYAIRFFGPGGQGTGTLPGSVAQLHCDGTIIKDRAQEVRLEGPVVGTPDWSNGLVKSGTIPPIDVNFDGSATGVFVDQPDWGSLNLQQIGTGYNFGGLSLGAFATDGGVYATDGGVFATDAGALATDGGVFATDGGAFATDGGAFATDGGVFATDGGVFATDGGAFATDAGDLDQTTLILSGSAGPPTGVTATNTIGSIVLSWTPPDGVSQSYNIYRCAGAGCMPSAPVFKSVNGGTTTPSFPDTVNDFIHAGATCPSGSTCYNTTYTYAVTSRAMVNSSVIESGFSQPPATSEVTHLFVIADAQTAVYGDPIPTATFKVHGDGAALPDNSVTCSYTPLVPRNAGTYPITCTGLATSSPTDGVTYNASYLTYTPGSLSIMQRPITVTAIADNKVYDATNGSLKTPMLTSGSLAYSDSVKWTETYDIQNVGNAHVMTPAGTVSDGFSGANYNVTFVTISSGMITPAPLTITPDAGKSKLYGQLFTLFTGTVTGLQGSDAGTATYSSTGTPAAAIVGAYDITSSFSFTSGLATNYTVATNTATGGLKVNPAPLTITASSPSKAYGATLPAVTAGYSGFVNGQTATATGVVTTAPTCVTTGLATSPVGGYPTSCSGAVAANYAISYVPGTLTVSPVPLSINPGNANRVYNTVDLAFPFTYVGLVNGDTTIATPPSCMTSTPQTANVGPYVTITCGGASSPNYSPIGYGPMGTLTVTPAPVTVTLSDMTQPYANSPLSPTVTTNPPGRAFSLTVAPQTAVGSYPVTATVTDPNYMGSANGTFVITPAVDLTALALNGNATTLSGPTALRLSSSISQTSSAWLKTQRPATASFSTSFSFQITHVGNDPGLGDGFAFVIQSDPAGSGTLVNTQMGGTLGYAGITNSIAIEFDTYQNTNFGDPSGPHIGIQSNGGAANSPDHTSNANRSGLPVAQATFADGNIHTATITYDAPSTTLSVFLDSVGTPFATATVDLSTFLGVGTGGNAFFGFTAATGAAEENSDILTWNWN